MNRTHLRPLHALVIIALLLALGLATAAALPAAEPSPLPIIRIGFATVGVGGAQAVGYGPLGSAQLKGLVDAEFAKDGIRVEWSFFRGAGPAVNEAIANGQLDVAWQGDFPAIIGKANGLRTRIVMANGLRGNSYLAVPQDSPARTLEDLVGRRVALHKGTNLQLVVDRILAAHHLGERDFRSINLDSLAGGPALAAKEIDGLWGGLELIELARSGAIRFVYSTHGQSPTLTRQTHVLVTEDFEAAHADLVQRLVDVLVREAAWESDEAHRAELFTLWTRMGLPVTTWEGEFAGSLLRQRQSPLLDGFFVAHYRAGIAGALDFKLIRHGFEIGSWIEPKYVLQAIHTQHLEGLWKAFDAQGLPIAAR
jgi:sulfonate transport system substrate-binding protein